MAFDALEAEVQLFLKAARSGNLDLLKDLAGELDDDDVRDANKQGALHYAAIYGKNEVCNFLLEELKMDVNARDKDGETPLIHAAMRGHTDTAKLLLDHAADPSISCNLRATALHHSAAIGDIALLRHFISKGADVNSKSDSGSPLAWAARHSQPQAVKILLELNANPNAEADDCITPLLSSIEANSLVSLKSLIQAGAEVNVSVGGATPLHIAANNGILEIINCLLEAGAEANATDEDGREPILVAAGRGNREAVEMLFPFTSEIESVPNWTVEGILDYLKSKMRKQKERMKSLKEANTTEPPKQDLPQEGMKILKEANMMEEPQKQDLPEVTPKAKKRSAEAKLRGDEAFSKNNFRTAVDAYTQAIDLDPTDGLLFSNRSLSWLKLGQAELALTDAKMCKALRPNWPKACYREGAALRLMQNFEEAARAFHEGVTLAPEKKVLADAFREAVEAGRKAYGTDNEYEHHGRTQLMSQALAVVARRALWEFGTLCNSC